MNFEVVTSSKVAQERSLPYAILVIDNWDDWFQFNTMYTLLVMSPDGGRHNVGSVKIGQFGMKPDQKRPDIPNEFEALGTEFYSLGQDDSYYQALNELGSEIRDNVLLALNDVAFAEPELFNRASRERVMQTSLLRSVTASTVNGQFRRLACGGARLTRYSFAYHSGTGRRPKYSPISLTFDVTPESQPPTNVHVIIGRNGVGKTHLLNAMTRALVQPLSDAIEDGRFEQRHDGLESPSFANLVSVTFSAFDPFVPISSEQNRKNEVHFSYIGLKRIQKTAEEVALPPKTPQMLSVEFSKSVKACRQGARARRWARALKSLETDPIFRDAQIADLAPKGEEDDQEENTPASQVFSRLSSGHKIVLLTITRLVEVVAERTLVLLDEPEAHLHPPLLSAFIRALSNLLIDRNGVAIIATHSPVVLQEVPRSCAWKVRRSGLVLAAERPEIETFGESVGILTREAFGLEVAESGFHRLLAEQVAQVHGYEHVLESFGGELGGEAKAIVRGLIAAESEEE